MNSVVATCFVLHNICEVFKEEFDEALFFEGAFDNHANVLDIYESIKDADTFRNTIIQYCPDVHI